MKTTKSQGGNMPGRRRRSLQGAVFHVMNRAVRRTVLFETPDDYNAFVRLVCEALTRFKINVIAFCLMPNHWHFVMICQQLEELSRCMHWLESTHANRWNGAHGLLSATHFGQVQCLQRRAGPGRVSMQCARTAT
jgi:putative transposase